MLFFMILQVPLSNLSFLLTCERSYARMQSETVSLPLPPQGAGLGSILGTESEDTEDTAYYSCI